MKEISDPNFTAEDLTKHFSSVAAAHSQVTARDAIVNRSIANSTVNDPASSTAAQHGAREFPTLRLQPAFQPSDDAAGYHVDDLLQYHDKDFLHNAYQALLKRFPDAEGFNRYLHRLRSGRMNKLDVLASLRYSAEGVKQSVRIKSLRFPALVRRASRAPIAGYFVRLLIAIARLPRNVEMQRQTEAHSIAQDERIAEHINELARHSTAELQRFATQHTLTLENIRRLEDRQQYLEDEYRQAVLELQTQHDELSERARELFETLDHNSNLAEQHAAQFREALAAQLERTATIESHTREAGEHLRGEIQSVNRNLQHARMQLTLQQQRIAALTRTATTENTMAESPAVLASATESVLASTIESSATPSHDEAKSLISQPHTEGAHILETDAFYAAFVERFRGSFDDIAARLQTHLPALESLPEGDIVDLGSGRGEWLELLRAHGRAAYGVDTNRTLAAACRARGLHVVEADALAHLRSLAPASVAAVCGFHLIEHLPTNALMELLSEAARVLLPGGLLLFETPNPENVSVGSHLFYTDPTHHHPLPSMTMRFLFEACGFDDVTIRNLHPRTSDELIVADADDEITRRFNRHFYSAMDYSISGRKPLLT